MKTRITFFVPLVLAWLIGPVPAQAGPVVQVGTTTVEQRSLLSRSGSSVATEWKAFAGDPKTGKLLQWVRGELGCSTTTVDAPNGFTNVDTLRYTQTGQANSADQEVRLTILPVKCTASRKYPKATVALLLARSPLVPSLAYPRLLVRYGNNGWMVEEFSLRYNGIVTKMTCKFGDCVFRTGLLVLQQRNGIAYKSLMGVLNASAAEPVFSTLQRVYDARKQPVGQPDLNLYSGVLMASNYEEEFSAGYISGTLTEALKPVRGESWLVQQAKQVLQSALKEVLKKVGESIMGWIAGLF